MKFYHYNQNNSGGRFDFDEKAGVTHHIIIEAEDLKSADTKMEVITEDQSPSCPCCGERWYGAFDDGGTDQPEVYGEHPAKADLGKWMNPEKECCIHYADGRKEWF